MFSIIRCFQAEWLKSRHTPLLLVHVLFPLIGAGVFAGYFHISGWSEMTNVTTFLEVLAIIFPFVIGIVVGMIVELENGAGHFQLILGTINRVDGSRHIAQSIQLFICRHQCCGLSNQCQTDIIHLCNKLFLCPHNLKAVNRLHLIQRSAGMSQSSTAHFRDLGTAGSYHWRKGKTCFITDTSGGMLITFSSGNRR